MSEPATSDAPPTLAGTMPRFAEKYTDAERARIADYAIRYSTTARRAIEEAESGRLFPNEDGTPGHSFTMPLKTAQDYIARERRARAKARLPNIAREGLDAAAGTLEQRAVAIAERHLRALEREGARCTADRAIKAVRLVAEVRKLANTKAAPAPPQPQGRETPSAEATTPAPGFLDQLAAQHATTSPANQIPPTPTERKRDEANPPATTTHNNTNTTPRESSGVPSCASAGVVAAGQREAGVSPAVTAAAELYGKAAARG